MNNDIYRLADKYNYLSNFKNKNIEFIMIDEVDNNEIQEYLDSYPIIIYHSPAIEAMVECEKKHIIKSKKITQNSYQKFKKFVDINFSKNTERMIKGLNDYLDIITNKSIVIVGAGPSLDDDIKSIKRLKENNCILSVGTAFIPLMKKGLKPDVVIITDPHPRVINQILDFDLDIPLIMMDTASYFLFDYWKGDIYICTLGNRKSTNKNNIVKSGGSVITVAFDIAVKANAKKIILAGADFSYTDNFSHARNAHMRKKISEGQEHLKVKNYYGNYNLSSRNLIIYKKWIEKYAKETTIPVYNLTSKGAKLKNIVRIEKKDIYKIL